MKTAPYRDEVQRRRTFAIISHPDAGKTTLTEKLLLYGGAIHLAGSVKQRRASRYATSDWMALEKERGISITTSVMQFEYGGHRLNLLDTPGHNDFSEDTYRTLSAVDSAVMLIDCVKGVEPQTIKLFDVCKLRKIPIVTFINKMDRHGREPLELLDEIEQVLGMPTVPMTWPVGAGQDFRGVYDREQRAFLRFDRAAEQGKKAVMEALELDDAALKAELGDELHARLVDEIALHDSAGNGFSRERFLGGEQTPVFFGSAMTSFGLEPFLTKFLELAPPPGTRAAGDVVVDAGGPGFSGFIFKIQANMDPNHRDRIAFMRVCSGRFERGMKATNVRTRRAAAIQRSVSFLAQERVTVEEAFGGDIVGIWDSGTLRIGDTLTDGQALEYDGIPSFSPELFMRVTVRDPMKRKSLKKGLEQLSDEGAVQLLHDRHGLDPDPILAAVGMLQLEVVQYRLKDEYGVDASFTKLPYVQARWVAGAFDATEVEERGEILCLLDGEERPLLLFGSDWKRRHFESRHPELTFSSAMQPARFSRK